MPIDIGQIAEEQKARRMKYKQFSRQELLKREECLYDERAKKLYKFLKSKNVKDKKSLKFFLFERANIFLFI